MSQLDFPVGQKVWVYDKMYPQLKATGVVKDRLVDATLPDRCILIEFQDGSDIWVPIDDPDVWLTLEVRE
jgi:hypothetical protein